MELNEYQRKTKETAIYPGCNESFHEVGIYYTALGLVSEAGEVAGKIKKVLRDKEGYFNPESCGPILKELGDCLWYISELADLLQTDLNEIAHDNIANLRDRKERGVLGGSGDDR